MAPATKRPSRDKLLKAALEYARRGWPVLPLHSVRKSRCTCGKGKCPSPGKHPHTRNGLKDATTDSAKIARWWRKWPEANVGIATGGEAGLVVLDVDPRNGGDESLAKLVKKHGPLPKTVEVRTGGGGRHYHFVEHGRTVKGKLNAFGRGLDLKATGGYVVVPPSIHASGAVYRWEEGRSPDEVDPATLPTWLRPKKTKKVSKTRRGKSKFIREGGRNERLASLAGANRRHGVNEEGILGLLTAENERVCRPPLSAEEVRGIAKSIGKYEPAGADRSSQQAKLIELTREATFFHDAAQEPYVAHPVGDHLECWPIESRTFDRWLRGKFWRTYAAAPGSQALHDALGVLVSKALYDGLEQPVFVRVAGLDESIWLDLRDNTWRAVEITKDGWKIRSAPAVRFIRPPGIKELPEPVAGGRVDELRPFLNIGSDEDWVLCLAWLTAALRPTGPYTVLIVNGEQGSAKSTFCRMLGSLIDPRVAPLRPGPRDVRDLMIAASNSWVLIFDNLSRLSSSMSDALCRLATGGGYSARALFRDADEKLFDVKRPVMANGISEFVSRSDLLGRAICLTLPRISSGWRTEVDLWREFREAHPRILGSLLDAVSIGLRRLPDVRQDTQRMADFATWGIAVEPSFGVEPGTFMAAYSGKRDASDALAVEMSPVGPSLRKFVADKRSWKGDAKTLLHELSTRGYSDFETRERVDWPRTPKGMSEALRRVAPNLRAIGVDVEYGGRIGKSRKRIIVLRKSGKGPAAPTAKTKPPKKARKGKARKSGSATARVVRPKNPTDL